MSDADEVLERLGGAQSAGDQIDVLRCAWGASGLVELSVTECEYILQKLGKASTRTEQREVLKRSVEERLIVSAFDVAISPLIMSQPSLRHLLKIMTSTVAINATAKSLAVALDTLEAGCFLSAAQATSLLSVTDLTDSSNSSRVNEWWHVVCARVLDKWNLREEEHTQVACYYGWDGAFLLQLLRQVTFVSDDGALASAAAMPSAELQGRVLAEQSAAEQGNPPKFSRQLQNRVLAYMGKADHFLYSHSRNVRLYASQLIAGNLGSGSSDVCAVCLDPTQNGTALWTCRRCSNHLHSSCHRGWARKRCEHDDEEEVPCPYCRSVDNPT